MKGFARQMPWLARVFPASSSSPAAPHAIDDDSVKLVAPIFPGPHIFENGGKTFSVQGAAGVNQAQSPSVPAGKVWYVVALHALHNDAVTPQSVSFRYVMYTGVYSLQESWWDGNGTNYTVAATEVYPCRKTPILVAAGNALNAGTDNIGGAAQLTIEGAYFEFDEGEASPAL